MRTLLISIAVGSCASAYAQNWALLNPAYKYNYSNDGTDTISNQIFVTHIDTLGVDSFRYELNGVAKLCDTCAGPQMYLWTNSPQFLQRSVHVGSGVWHFHDPGSFVVLPGAPLGANWLFDTLANVQATVTLIDTVDQFGSPVGRKTITLSDGGQLMISEALGILSWSDHALIGVQGPQVGRVTPSLSDMFIYQAGDVVEYSSGNAGTDGFQSEFGFGRLYKFTVDYGVPEEMAMNFSGMMMDHHWNWVSYWNGPSYVSYDHVTYLGSSWIAGIPELPWAELLFSYPGELVLSPTLGGQGWSDTLACIAEHGMDTAGNYILTCRAIPIDFTDGAFHFFPVSSVQLSDSIPLAIYQHDFCSPSEECGVLYTEGDGLNWYRGDFFEAQDYYVRTGAVINGDTVGTVHTDDYLLTLAVLSPDKSDAFDVFPNPATDHITFDNIHPGAVISILDMRGRVIRSHVVISSSENMEVGELEPGPYLILVDGASQQCLIIAR